ncbi:MAG: leucine-rich repeat domain-containing protein, partial [Bacteroidales bacterium]|nr:leucine-rich repeat domain-containing protein [Bacteroidales bacterium]
VTSIGSSAFSGCSGLPSVTIPNSVTSIGSSAFSGCSGLTSVTIPNSVTSIGRWAFSGCSGLTSVTIPNSVTSIGSSAFAGCSGLTSIVVEDGNPVYDSRNNCNAIIETATNTLHSGCKTTITPNSVTSIGDDAFRGCSGLTSVTIPNSVESIGDDAFGGCSGLTSVTIPNSVTSIGDYAFEVCSGLTSVTIGNSVTSIGERAFYNCPELLDVYCYAEKVPSTKSIVFYNSPIEYATLHVPDASIDSYKATAPWSSFGKIVGLSGEEPEQPEVEKCATPVVTYAEGKLSFSCETEGAEFVTNVVAEDAKEYYDAEIELSATYNIEVFATKANCENSDTVNVALVWVENGDVNEDTGVISVQAAPVLVQGNGGVLSVSGVAKGTDVVVYTISGTEVTRSTATNGTATISTGLQSGTIVVVKFGNKSVKLKI